MNLVEGEKVQTSFIQQGLQEDRKLQIRQGRFSAEVFACQSETFHNLVTQSITKVPCREVTILSTLSFFH